MSSHRPTYADSPGLFDEVRTLLDAVFRGFSARVNRARLLGLRWDACSTPFVRHVGRGIVSHVGILEMTFVLEGQETPVGVVDGSSYELHTPWWMDFGRHVSLVGAGSGQYMEMEGSEIYGGGFDLGLGIRPVVRDLEDTFGWQITPFAGLHAIGSYDGATAGLLDQFGIANRLEFKLAHEILLVAATQFSFFDSLKIEIEDIEIDPRVEQQVLKNGLMVDVPLIRKISPA